MKAFYGIPELKEHYLARIEYHRQMDHLIQGVGWQSNGVTKGCAIGCTFENYRHQDMVDEWDVPLTLAKLEDCIFEGLPKEVAMEWPFRFTNALKPGVDYSMAWPKFAVKMLERQKRYAKGFDSVCKAIDQTLEIYKRWISGEDITTNEFRYAAESAESAEWEWMADTLIEVIEGEK
ncbi:MAG: hypothetical protein CV087_23860 [Candidatus Brocadia sp. WS118]|nr:MAG: hypothetical protein CV087_23860 [Candidatus Brocadia sp. WS118]